MKIISRTDRFPLDFISDLGPSDVPACRSIYRTAVLSENGGPYTARQLSIWSKFSESEVFESFVLKDHGICIRRGREIFGFGSFEINGHLKSLYVHPDHKLMGIGTTLLNAMEAKLRNVPVIRAEASEFSKCLFLKNGYSAVGEERRVRDGVVFIRYNMEKRSG